MMCTAAEVTILSKISSSLFKYSPGKELKERMHLLFQRLLFFCLCILLSHAFVMPKSSAIGNFMNMNTYCASQSLILPGKTAATMTKNNMDGQKGTNEIDYVKILGMFINPLNPYSWFLYFFVGINVFSILQNQ